jgi:UDP-GlcNAc3NAcA epimerase
MRLVSIVGARPQFVKIAPLCRAIEAHNGEQPRGPAIEHIILHTGQHYDARLSEIFFAELELPQAAVNLGVGSGSHGRQTAQMLEKIEQALCTLQPDAALIYGDTNSTLAAALAAVKLGISVAHVEAGLRSFNRQMPEEINRVVADHVADLLLAPTHTAIENLAAEGLASKAVFAGDIMYDAVLFNRARIDQPPSLLQKLGLEPRHYSLVTVHRAENTDDGSRLSRLLNAFNDLAAAGQRLVFVVHPRTAQRLSSAFPAWRPHPRLQLIEPIGYLDMLRLISNARITLTDSGGLQKEAFFLGCPCITLREETEWMETLIGGGNVLTGVDARAIFAAVAQWQRLFPDGKADFSQAVEAAFGAGDAARHILDAVLAYCRRSSAE